MSTYVQVQISSEENNIRTLYSSIVAAWKPIKYPTFVCTIYVWKYRDVTVFNFRTMCGGLENVIKKILPRTRKSYYNFFVFFFYHGPDEL